VKKGPPTTVFATLKALAKQTIAIDAGPGAANPSPLQRRVGLKSLLGWRKWLPLRRRSNVLSRRETARLYAHIRAQFDADEARLAALMEKAA
jgi:hypothetical protein